MIGLYFKAVQKAPGGLNAKNSGFEIAIKVLLPDILCHITVYFIKKNPVQTSHLFIKLSEGLKFVTL